MNHRIPAKFLKSELAQMIATDSIRAALFSTYTFSRGFFEEEILDGLLCDHGLRRSLFPTTALVDRDMFRGSGWGYDVRCFQSNRLWHPKIIALMVSGNGSTKQKRTILVTGSGNLTPSGWQKNLELFISFEWEGWMLPHAVEEWIYPSLAFAAKTRFGDWYKKWREGTCPVSIDRQLFGNLFGDTIWSQWKWYGHWRRAHVIAPYLDSKTDEADDIPDDYLHKLAEFADVNGELHVYLSGTPDGRVKGNWSTFKNLNQKVRLTIHRLAHDSFHAKLQIVQVGNEFHILGGSPNPTSSAMLRRPQQRGNVEIAWQTKAARIPPGLLPESEEVELRKANFVPPIATPRARIWRVLKSVEYSLRDKRLTGLWIGDHSMNDTVLFIGADQITIPSTVSLRDEYSVRTIPRDPNLQRDFQSDWVPIQFPFSSATDDPVFQRPWTFEECLSVLSGKEDELGSLEVPKDDITTVEPGGDNLVSDQSNFEWHERVLTLERALKNLEIKIYEEGSSKKFWFRLIEASFLACKQKKNELKGIPLSWYEWAMARTVGFLVGLDRRYLDARPFVSLGKKWKRELAPRLGKTLEE